MTGTIELIRWLRVGVPIHAVALSGDGRHILLGCERDLRMLDRQGMVLTRYHRPGQDVPFHLVTMTPTMEMVMVAIRSGELIQIELEETDEGFDAWPLEVYYAEADLYDLALALDGRTLAIGHLSPALTVLDMRPFLKTEEEERPEGADPPSGPLLWRRHPDDRNATEGKTWTVALDSEGERLYVGCSGSRQWLLAALNAASGEPIGHRRTRYPVTRVVALEEPSRVAAVLTDGTYSHFLACYPPQMEEPEWELGFDHQITALTADPEANLVAVGSGYEGRITLLDGATGETVAEYARLGSLISSLAVADGRYLAAGTLGGQLAYLQYSAEGFRL